MINRYLMTRQPRRNPRVPLTVGPFFRHPFVRVLNRLEAKPVSYVDPFFVQHIVWVFRAFTTPTCLPGTQYTFKMIRNTPLRSRTRLDFPQYIREYTRGSVYVCVCVLIYRYQPNYLMISSQSSSCPKTLP